MRRWTCCSAARLPLRSRTRRRFLAKQAAQTGGTACAVLNGANEAAVGLFLQGRIGFNDIARRVEHALAHIGVQYQPSLADILEADRAARRAVTAEKE